MQQVITALRNDIIEREIRFGHECDEHVRAAVAEMREALTESLTQMKYLQAFSGGTIMTHLREEQLGRTIEFVCALLSEEGGK